MHSSGECNMSFLRKKEIPGNKAQIQNCVVVDFGDLKCPNCLCTIVTPDFCIVLPGTGRCPICHKSFMLTKENATIANREHEKALSWRNLNYG